MVRELFIIINKKKYCPWTPKRARKTASAFVNLHICLNRTANKDALTNCVIKTFIFIHSTDSTAIQPVHRNSSKELITKTDYMCDSEEEDRNRSVLRDVRLLKLICA